MSDALASQILRDMIRGIEEHEERDEGGQRLSATGHCLRQQYYDVTRSERRVIPADQYTEITDGNLHEADVKAILRLAGHKISGEQVVDGKNQGEEVVLRIGDGLSIPGHIDGNIDTLDDIPILEVKAMSFLRFCDLINRGVELSNEDYWMQVNGYLAAKNRPIGVLIAKAKDSSAVRGEWRRRSWNKKHPEKHEIHPEVAVSPGMKFAVQVIYYDQETVDTIMERHENLQRHIKAGMPPAREYSPSDWQCKWCDHSLECYGVQLKP